jgi:hypothetical protein
VLTVASANVAPSVDVGPDLTVPPGAAVTLSGAVLDDGLPSGSLVVAWSQVSGPATVAFTLPDSASTLATFPAPGVYVLRLEASDGSLSGSDELSVTASDFPDLVVTAIDTGQVTWDARSLVVSGTAAVTVANPGAGPAGAFVLTLFEDHNGNGTLEADDTVLGAAPLSGLAPGQSASVSVALAGSVLFPGNAIHAFADSANALAESDETNNLASSVEACEPPAQRPFEARREWWWPGLGSVGRAANVLMTPIVADIDRDGVTEIIVVTGLGLTVLNGRTGALEFNRPFVGGAATTNYANLAVGNLDADPQLEIVVPTPFRLHVVEHDGSVKWTR